MYRTAAVDTPIPTPILEALDLLPGSSLEEVLASIEELKNATGPADAPGIAPTPSMAASSSRLTQREMRFCSTYGVKPEVFATKKQDIRLSAREQQMLDGRTAEEKINYIARKTAISAGRRTA